MIQIACEGYQFGFVDAISAFKFDSTDINDPFFHGAPMKAVDMIVEFKNEYVFIEIKDFHDIALYDERNALNHLKEVLKYKFRDSVLYRFAEAKTDKPIHYICLLNLKPSSLYGISKILSKELPVGIAAARWKKPLAKSCIVINESMFRTRFTKWSLEPISFA